VIDQQIKFEAFGRRIDFRLELDPYDTVDNFLLLHLQNGQCFEAEQVWVMLRTLQEGDFAIDVGANIGFFTLIMSQLVGNSGIIFAFEPASNNLPTLSKHLRRNNIHNVQVIDQPVWCRDEEVTFYINSDSRGSNALFDPANWHENVKSQANPKPLRMQAISLDSFNISKERVKLIKIDTEGAEQKIMEGAKTFLEKYHPPYILAELNPHGLAQSGCDDETFRTYMKQFGYEMFFLHMADQLPTYVPSEIKVLHLKGTVVSNVLFSDWPAVVRAWPEMMG